MPILRKLTALADEDTRKSWFIKRKRKITKPAKPARKPKQATVPKEWEKYRLIQSTYPEKLSFLKADATVKPRIEFVDKKLITPLMGSEFPKDNSSLSAAMAAKSTYRFHTPIVHEHKGKYYVLDDNGYGPGVIHHMRKATVPVSQIKLSERAPLIPLIKMQHKKLTRNKR